jgi:electron transfer flavoprotein alpha subunit
MLMAETLVFCRIKGGQLTRNSLEVLGAGSKLAGTLGESLGAIVTFQTGEEAALKELIAHGAQNVYAVHCDVPYGYYPEYGFRAAETVCRNVGPRLVLFVADMDGREIGPKLAHSLDAGIVSECIDLEADCDSGRVYGLKPVYGGKAIARLAAREVQVFTLREHAFGALDRNDTRQGEIRTIEITMPEGAGRIRESKFVEEKHAGVKLEEADIVVAGGRGIGGKDQFQDIEGLAQLFGGAPAATRAAVDAGWVPSSYQVGQTGKIIAPNLYLSIGISGASQHIAGMSGSKCVVAINKDPDAPIFRVAQFGIVEDYRKVVPILRDRIKEMLA